MVQLNEPKQVTETQPSPKSLVSLHKKRKNASFLATLSGFNDIYCITVLVPVKQSYTSMSPSHRTDQERLFSNLGTLLLLNTTKRQKHKFAKSYSAAIPNLIKDTNGSSAAITHKLLCNVLM